MVRVNKVFGLVGVVLVLGCAQGSGQVARTPTVEVAPVTVYGDARVDSGYCRTIPVSEGFDLLPCVPRTCAPTFCESGVVTVDGSLVCLDSDEVYPAGHWAVDDWQEDGPDSSVHFLVEY